jgi:NHL repeat
MTGTGWLTLGTQGSGDKQFNEPWGLHVDHKGRIYVADYGNNRGHGDVHLRPPIDIVALAVNLARLSSPDSSKKGIRPGCLQ